jgi:hypothetical protein
MNELRGRFGIVRAQQLCEWCHTPVLSAGLYLFPCGHAFHIDCQERYMLRGHLSDAERTRVRKLKAALARCTLSPNPRTMTGAEIVTVERSALH